MNDSVPNNVICSNPDCKVAETGRCVEGLALDKCSQYGQEPVVIDNEDGDHGEDLVEAIDLPSSSILNFDQAGKILRQSKSHIIAMLGPNDSGKTSLIAGLYDLFQQGPVDEVVFSRSYTLHAFEQACHQARATSRRQEPDMDRTPRGNAGFYHLEIGLKGGSQYIALMLCDRTGEDYKEAADDISIVPSFLEVSRAHVLTILVDGERLLDVGERHNLISDIKMMLQAILEGSNLNDCCRLGLVLTKLDLILESDHKERAFNDFEKLRNDVKQLFGQSIAVIKSFHIAASPKSTIIPRGKGLSELLSFWLSPIIPSETKLRPRPYFNRSFHRLSPTSERNSQV